jgi:hypothetical protein
MKLKINIPVRIKKSREAASLMAVVLFLRKAVDCS